MSTRNRPKPVTTRKPVTKTVTPLTCANTPKVTVVTVVTVFPHIQPIRAHIHAHMFEKGTREKASHLSPPVTQAGRP